MNHSCMQASTFSYNINTDVSFAVLHSSKYSQALTLSILSNENDAHSVSAK